MRKNLAKVFTLFAAAAMLTACSGGKTAESKSEAPKEEVTEAVVATSASEEDLVPVEGGMLKIGLPGTPKNLDPKHRTNIYESSIIDQVCDSLIIYSNDQSEYLPSLAKSWEISEDGKEYIFYLRDDVHFHKGKFQDGRLFCADDVKYSLERAKEAKNVTLVMLDHVEVIDDFTVKCVLNEANTIFMDALTGPTNMIIPKEEVEGWGDEFGAHLIGTGPFMLKEFNLDQDATVVRNDNYWGPRPYLDGAVFKVITDLNQQVNGLKTGEIDFSTKITSEAIKMVQDDPNLMLLRQPNTSINFVGFNTQKEPFNDIRVRQALAAAVDVKDACVGLYQYQEATYAGQPMPPASWGYDPSMEELNQKYDPELAKKLMTEAGYPDGFKMKLNYANTSAGEKLGTILQQYWKTNLNVDLELVGTEWAVYSQTVTQGDHDAYIATISSTVDPHNFTGKCMGSQYSGTIPGGCHLHDDEMDRLVTKSLEVSDQGERKEVYKDIVNRIIEVCPAVYVSNDNIMWGTTKKVHGLCQKTYWYLCNSEVNAWMEQ